MNASRAGSRTTAPILSSWRRSSATTWSGRGSTAANSGLPTTVSWQVAARRHLAASGRRALSRQDFGAALNLLERAAALVPPAEVDVPLELSVVIALAWRGQAPEAERRAGSIAERAAAVGDRLGELCARLDEAVQRAYVEPEGAVERLAPLVEEALPLFEAAGDDFALFRGYRALAEVTRLRLQWDASADACDRAAAHARRAGFPSESVVALGDNARLHGPTPLSELLAWQDTQDERARRNPWVRSDRARALAMLGRFDEARAIVAGLRAELADRGGGILAVVSSVAAVHVELVADDPAAAVPLGEELCRLYEDLGHLGFLIWAEGMLAEAYYALGRLDEADAAAGRSAELEASDDRADLWRQVRAKVLARRGEHAEAERLAREAIDINHATDMPNAQADAYGDLAEVLTLRGSPEAAAQALEQALKRYERKENVVMAERVRARLAGLRPSETAAGAP